MTMSQFDMSNPSNQVEGFMGSSGICQILELMRHSCSRSAVFSTQMEGPANRKMRGNWKMAGRNGFDQTSIHFRFS
ncbi:hypothetical protein SAMN04488548_1116 [Gordonia westfalica]|uniref:Uncharacterized protein n=1 Tax=Gordonia westfalica TaxID=158898 RepID=A0A1H2DQZ4_9ACTN|nr:hypothetical protein SAMN04488548_1116 [Gordonia westfalica]